MDCLSNPIEIKWIETERLAPNPWNPNRMSRDLWNKLKREIREKGFVAPILARAIGDGYQVVDGEHRWRIARELGIKKVPCVLVGLSGVEARIKTLQLNGLRGENDPARLARLLAEVGGAVKTEDLARSLPWSSHEIKEMIAMATKELEEKTKGGFTPARLRLPDLELFAIAVSPGQKQTIEGAIKKARARQATISEGAALAEVCGGY